MVWRASRPLTAALAAMTITAALVPPATAWAGKRIVDAVVARNRPGALHWVLVSGST
jgi:ATP-binding cassette, subfamily B, bacterial